MHWTKTIRFDQIVQLLLDRTLLLALPLKHWSQRCVEPGKGRHPIHLLFQPLPVAKAGVLRKADQGFPLCQQRQQRRVSGDAGLRWDLLKRCNCGLAASQHLLCWHMHPWRNAVGDHRGQAAMWVAHNGDHQAENETGGPDPA